LDRNGGGEEVKLKVERRGKRAGESGVR
jgi:hypothetical protein